MVAPSEDWRTAETDELLAAIVDLETRDEAAAFLRDLCTLGELHDLAQRWHVVRLLAEGRHYGDVSRTTGASTATVTRIAQWLHHGTGGYTAALARRDARQAARDVGPRDAATPQDAGQDAPVSPESPDALALPATRDRRVDALRPGRARS